MWKLDDKTTIMDLWRDAGLAFHDRDQNNDGLVDEAEFVMFSLYELSHSIANDLEDQKGAVILDRRRK